MCEIKNTSLIDAKNGGYLEVYCVGIINNIWKKRGRVKTYKNGSTSPLYEGNYIPILNKEEDDNEAQIKDEKHYLSEEVIPDESVEYDISRDIDEVLLHNLIDKYKESNDINDRFASRVFYYSKFKYKNVRQFAINSRIPYGVCLRAFESFKEKVKEEMCKY